MENPGGFPVEHALVKLAAVAMWLGVVERRVVVHVLFAGFDVKPVQQSVRAFPVQDHRQVLAIEPGAERNREHREVG